MLGLLPCDVVYGCQMPVDGYGAAVESGGGRGRTRVFASLP
jgi:hypothetical protein